MQQPLLNVTEDKTEEMVETGASKRENLTWNNQSEPVEGATDCRNLTVETPELKWCFLFLSFFFLSDILEFFRHVQSNWSRLSSYFFQKDGERMEKGEQVMLEEDCLLLTHM